MDQQQTNQQINLNPIKAKKFEAPLLEQEVQKVKEQSLTDILSGAPDTPKTLNFPQNPINLYDTPVTKSFNVRDEVMSNLHLMDEDLNYTDTYTNYVNQGGQPPKGYEYAHNEILKQERYDEIFQKVEDGELSQDTALMEAYGRDILAASFNIDVTSVQYWKNKFLNEDYSNPFDNDYLMSQVLTAAEEYHKTRQASAYAHSQMSEVSTAASLLGQELSAKQVKSIFGDLGKWAEDQELSDREFLSYINSGQIGAQSRLIQIDENTYAYLHTDGKLHSLVKGKDIIFDEKGNPKEISLNGSDVVDFADHFASSFISVFTNLGKLGTYITALPAIFSGNYTEELNSQMRYLDAALNDWDLNALGRLDHIDIDGFNWNSKDIFMAIGDVTGMLAGSMALTGISSSIVGAGEHLMQGGNALSKVAGGTVREVGRAGLRSTGWFAGLNNNAAEFYLFNPNNVLASGRAAHWLNTAFKVTPVMAMKEYQQVTASLYAMNAQKQISNISQGKDSNEGTFTQEEILQRALGHTAFSYATSVILSSNIESSIYDRLGTRDYATLAEIDKGVNEKLQEALLQKATHKELKKLLSSKTNYLKLQNFVDYLNTLAGLESQAFVTTAKKSDGSNVSFAEFIGGYTDSDTEVGNLLSRPDFWKNAVQTGVMQYREYSRGRSEILKGYNVGLQQLHTYNNELMRAFDDKIAHATDDQKQSLVLVKQDFISHLNDTNNGASYEERFISALDNLCNQLGQDNVPDIVRDTFNKTVNTTKLEYYKEIADYMEASLDLRRTMYEKAYEQSATGTNYFKNMWNNFLSNHHNKTLGMDKVGSRAWANFEKIYNESKQTDNSAYDFFLKEVNMLHTSKDRDADALSIFKDSLKVTSGRRIDKGTKKALDKFDLDPNTTMVYKLVQDNDFNHNVYRNIMGSSFEQLSKDPSTGIIKLDDYNYALDTTTGVVRQLLTFEQLTSLNVGLYNMVETGEYAKGVENVLGAFYGDDALKVTDTERYDALNNFLETAVNKKSLTELQAADILHHLLHGTEADRLDIRKRYETAIKDLQPGTTAYDAAPKILKKLAYIEAFSKVASSVGKKKIANTTQDIQSLNIISNIDKNGNVHFSKEADEVFDLLYATGRWKEDKNTLKLNIINQINSAGGGKLLPEDRDIIDEMKTSSDISEFTGDDKSAKRTGDILSGNLYKKSEELRKNGLEAINNSRKEIVKYQNKITHNASSGKYLTLDLSNDAGEKTNQQIKNIQAVMDDVSAKEYHVDYDVINNITDEVAKRVEIAKQFGTSLLVFDLEDSEQIAQFYRVANSLNIFENIDPNIPHTREELIMLLPNLKNNWNNSITFSEGTKEYLKINEDTQKILSKVQPKYNELKLYGVDGDGEKENIDYVKEVLSKAQFNKLPKNTKKSHTGILQLLPFGNKRNYQETTDTSYESVATSKAGIIAGKGAGANADIIVEIIADAYEQDPELANYCYIRGIIEKANRKDFTFSYYAHGDKDINSLRTALTNAHIIGTEDSFYEEQQSTNNCLRIVLKPGAQDAMIKYLDSSDKFNLFRILPLYSDRPIEKGSNYVLSNVKDGRFTYTNIDGVKSEALIPDMYNGNDEIHQDGLFKILNISSPTDLHNVTKSRVLGELFSNNDTLEYDPFYGNKHTNTQEREEALLNYRTNPELLLDKDFNDYEAKLIARLAQAEKDYTSDNNDEAYKYFYQDENIVRRLLKRKEYNPNSISSSNTKLKEEIKGMYIKAHIASQSNADNALSITYSGSSPYRGIYAQEDNLYISPATLQKITGDDYYLNYDESDPKSIAVFDDALDKALDNFNKFVDNPNLRSYLGSPYNITLFEQDPVSKVLQGLIGNDGYIPIEDVEYWMNLNDKQLNAIVEAYDGKISLEQLQKIRKDAQSMSDILKRLGMQEQSGIKSYRQYTDLDAPSLEVNKKNLVTNGTGIDPVAYSLLNSYDGKNTSSEKYFSARDGIINSLNEKYNKLQNPNDFRTATLNHADDTIREMSYTPQNAEILNVENSFALEQHDEIINKTYEGVIQDFNIDKENIAGERIVHDMYFSAMDFSADKERQTIKVYNTKTGVNMLQSFARDDDGNVVPLDINEGLAFNGSNYFEVFSSLNNLKADESSVFVILDKHALNTFDGIDYKYLPLTEENLDSLKKYYLGLSFDSFLKTAQKRTDFDGNTVPEFVTYLQRLQANHKDEFDKLFSSLISSQTSKLTAKRQAIANMLTLDEFKNMTASYINSAATPSLLKTNNYGNEAVVNYVNNSKNSLDSDNMKEQVQAAFAVYGRHEHMLTEEQKNILNSERNFFLNDIGKDLDRGVLEDVSILAQLRYGSDEYHMKFRDILDKYSEEQLPADKLLKLYLAMSNNPEVLTYKTSKWSFNDYREKTWSDAQGKIISPEDLSETNLKLSDIVTDDEHNVGFDLEGAIPNIKKNVYNDGTLDDIFQAHFSYKKDGEDVDETIFILHKNKSPEEYVAQKHIKDNSYYREKEGYREAVDMYLKGSSPDSSVRFMTEDEFIEYLNEFKDRRFIAFNGRNYDFSYIKNHIIGKGNTMFDAMDLDDMFYRGDDAQRRALSVITKFENAHNATEDTHNMMDWMKEAGTAYTDSLLPAKRKILNVTDGFLEQLGVDEDKRSEIMSSVDKDFRAYYGRNHFNQYFPEDLPDGIESTYIMRQLNHLRLNDIGYVLYNLVKNPDFIKVAGVESYSEALKNYDNIIDNIVNYAITNKVTPRKAIFELMDDQSEIAQSLITEENEKAFFADKANALSQYNADIDRSSIDFQEMKKEILANPDMLISKEEYENSTKYAKTQTYIINTSDLVSEFGDNISDDMKDVIMRYGTSFVSGTKDNDLSQFKSNEHFKINNKNAIKLQDTAENIFDLKGEIASIRDKSTYKKIFSLAASDATEFKALKYNTKTKRFEQSDEVVVPNAGTIIMDRRRFYDLCRSDIDSVISDDGEFYVETLRQPSANKHQTEYFKVQVVEGENGMAWTTPMVWRSKFAGDFDGDNITNFAVFNKAEQAIAKFEHENMYLGDSIQENLGYYLNSISTRKGDIPQHLITSLLISKDSEVIKIAQDIDSKLSNFDISDEELNNRLRNVIDKRLDNYVEDYQKVLLTGDKETRDELIDSIVKEIGVKTVNSHRYIGVTNLRNDRNSYSHESILMIMKDKAGIKTNLADSIFGFHKQRYMISDTTTEHMEDMPLMKMSIAPTIMADDLYDYIDRVDWNSSKVVEDYYDTIKNTVNSYTNSHKLDSSTMRYLSSISASETKDAFINTIANSDDKAEAATIITKLLFKNIDDLLQEDKHLNNTYAELIKGDLSNDYNELRTHKEKLLSDLNSIRGDKLRVRGLSSEATASDEAYASSIDTRLRKNTTKFVDDINRTFKHNRVKVAIISGAPLGENPDGLWLNPKTNITNILQSRIKSFKAFEPSKGLNFVNDDNTVNFEIVESNINSDIELLKRLSGKTTKLTESNKNKVRDINSRLSIYSSIMKVHEEHPEYKVFINKESKDNYYISVGESLVGHKGYAIGKGMIDTLKSANGDFDVLMNEEEFTRMSKAGMFPKYSLLEKDAPHRTNIDIETNQGQKETRSCVILKDVPFNLVATNDKDTPNKPQKLDMMTLESMDNSFTAHGTLGKSILRFEDDGSLTYSNNILADPIIDANNANGVCWRNGCDLVQTLRAIALGQIISDENLWGNYKTYAKNLYNIDTNIEDFNDFQEAILNSNPTSKEFHSAILGLVRFLDEEGYDINHLINTRMSEKVKGVFSPELEKILDPYEQGSIYDYAKVKLRSKTKARANVAPASSFYIGGLYNKGETSARRNPQVLSSEAYYIPMKDVWNAIFGYYPNTRSILQGTVDEIFGYDTHYEGEQGLNFMPKSKRYAFLTDAELAPTNANISTKSGQPEEASFPDSQVVYNQKGYAFNKGEHKQAIHKDMIPGKAYEALANNRIGAYTVSQGNRLASVLRTMIEAPDKVTGYIRAGGNQISEDLIMNDFMDKLTVVDGYPVYSLVPVKKQGTYSYLTGKGNDFVTSNLNFYSMKDIYNKVAKVPDNIDISDVKGPTEKTNRATPKLAAEITQNVADAIAYNSKATKNFTAPFDNSLVRDTQFHMDFTRGADNVDVFTTKPLDYLMTSTGIHIGKNDRGDTINVSMSIENAYGQAQYIEANGNEILFSIQRATNNLSTQEFQDYMDYIALQSAEANNEDISTTLKAIGKTQVDYETDMKANYNRINKVNPQLKQAVDNWIQYNMDINDELSRIYGEPFGNLTYYLNPRRPLHKKDFVAAKYTNNIRSALNFNEYSMIDKENCIKSNMVFDLFEAGKVMNRERAKLIANVQVSNTLHERGLLDNVKTINAINDYLSGDNIDLDNLYVKDPDSEENVFIHNTIIDIIRRNTDLDVYGITRSHKKPMEQIKALYASLNDRTNELVESLPEKYSTSYTDIKYALSRASREDEPLLQLTFDTMTARILVGQRLMEMNRNIATNVDSFINSVYASGKVFANQWGQKLDRNSYISPIGDSSAKWLVDNIEIASNNQSVEKWNQFLVEKALRGELYIMNSDLADTLEDKYFLTKTPPKIIQQLSKISKLTAGLQMAMPAKMIGRLGRFTGSDAMLGGMYSPYAFGNLARSSKELSAAAYSGGKSVEEGSDLYDYIMREGQPLNQTGKEPITFTEDLNSRADKVINFFTKPLAWQNHIGRYAIWLAAKESFDRGDPWYGPTYYMHDQIDNLADNRDKATLIMDTLIGSPGGFPYLSKKTNGLLLYTTFPMNLTRTGGAYAMSALTLFQEGLTSENAPQWMRTIAAPSCTAIVAAYLGSLLISYVCDKYKIPEEEEKKWKKAGVSIDPLGTMLGGTPSVVYDSINPVYQLGEMYISPWTNEYNKTFGEKAFGFLNQNLISKLNPALKSPIEVVWQKDLMGSSLIDTSSSYTMYENGLRKILGFFAGSGVANSIIDQYKIDKYSDDPSFITSMWKGLVNGISGDLGNQKSWKKDTSNYYNSLKALSNYSYVANKGSYNDAEYDDLMDGKYMADHRNYSKSYGSVDEDAYKRISKQLKKMIQAKTPASTVYAYITDEWNKGASEATLRKALNANSLTRKLNSLYGNASKTDFYRTLSDSDLAALERALRWEAETYPLLKDFFPDSTYTKTPYINMRRYYSSGGSSYSRPYTPRTYYPKTSTYRPTSLSNKKVTYNPARSSINKVEVNISPQMAVWKDDYDQVYSPSEWSDRRRKGPVKLLDQEAQYINNQFYNNLNSTQKRKKSGK